MNTAMTREILRPQLGALARAQAYLVHIIKMRATASLHRTQRGEALLLNLYLWAEVGAEGAVLNGVMSGQLPDWLSRQMTRHVSDEARHAQLLRQRLAEIGAKAGHAQVDAVSRWKMRSLEKLVQQTAVLFGQGPKVPLLAIAYRMEEMGVRVLERHLQVLARLGETACKVTPTREVLQQITADERHHVRSCEGALQALVVHEELPALREVLARIDALERAFAVTGALVLLGVGYFFSWREAVQRFWFKTRGSRRAKVRS